MIQPKLQKLAEEKEEKERQITELESLLVSKEKCRLELMDEHASALHSLKSMGESLEAMEEKIQDMKVEVKSIGESLEAMEDKIQDMKVEGIENIRYIHLHILELLKKNFVDIIVRFTSRIFSS